MLDTSHKRISGPVIRLHPNDNVLIARLDVAIGTPVADGLYSKSQVQAGHKIASRAIKAGEPILKYNVCIGFAASDIARRHAAALAQHGVPRVRPRLCVRARLRAGAGVAGRAARDLRRHRAARRPRRHAQLRRHPVDRQLLGDRRAQDRRVVHTGAPRRVPEHRRRRRVQPPDGLRHGDDRRADGPAATHDGRLRDAREFRRGARHRARLRAQPALGLHAAARPAAGAEAACRS